MRRFLVALALAGVAHSAQAADLSDLPFLRGSVSEGLSRTQAIWQGFYVGGQAGTGRSDMNFKGATRDVAAHLLSGTTIENEQSVSQWPIMGKASSAGQGFGGFAGYNSQWEDVIVGAEFSYLHGAFGGSQSDSMTRFFTTSNGYTDTVTNQGSAQMRITDIGTVRARGGYMIDRFLPYAFAGVALGEADILRSAHVYGTQVNASAAPGYTNVPFDFSATDAKNKHFIYGYTAGLGVDVQLFAGLFARAEWEYVRFSSSINTSVNTLRAGLGYRF